MREVPGARKSHESGGDSAAKRWEDMDREELLKALRREHGHRMNLGAEVKRLRGITKAKRDDLAVIAQLDAEVSRLTAQTPQFWKNAYEDQLRRKRTTKKRLDIALAGLRLAVLWLRYFDGNGPEPEAPVFDVLAAWDEAVAKEVVLDA